MEPEIQPPAPEALPVQITADGVLKHETLAPNPDAEEYHGLRWFFIGSQGLRAGWSVLIFLALTIFFQIALRTVSTEILKQIPHTKSNDFTPIKAFLQEAICVLALLGAGVIVAFLERRRILDYNLTGPRRGFHFLSGLVAGFLALSALVGTLAWGGWLHFGPVALSGTHIFGFAAAWGTVFLLTGFFEEGSFRCYLQFTLTRGINFWWAIGLVGAMCLSGYLAIQDQSLWGVYFIALLGLAPCWILQVKKVSTASFWQAAWVTSTFFGFIHTGNNGENWIGIFAAGTIGFVFCVSVRVTGSAWWAIGCHAAWDWAETYFYGTADSGMVPHGHYLTTNPVGAVLWSGGADGPEGSLLVLPVILLLLLALLVLYGRGRTSATEQAAR
jgi:hypothetical protein